MPKTARPSARPARYRIRQHQETGTGKRDLALEKNSTWLRLLPNLFKVAFLLLLFILIKVGLLPGKIISLIRPIQLIGQIRLSGSKKRGRPRRHQAFKMLPRPTRIRIILSALLLVFFLYTLTVAKLTSQLPSPANLSSTNGPLTTQILDRKGRLLYQIYEDRNRKIIKLSQLPPELIQATVAIEDKHFFIHPGVDPEGMLRALRRNLSSKNSSTQEGGSTITQQLIKNTLLTPEKTWSRKIKEVILAFWVERLYSKEQILEMYFNQAPYGGPAWGVETAAEMYFGKSAHDLTLSESAYLAGLPASPTEFSPYGTHPEQGKQRQQEVLRRMVEDSYLNQEQAKAAFSLPLVFQPPISNIKAPHFVMYVRSLLAQKYGEKVVSQGGLKVMTALDLDLQEMAESIVSDQVAKLKDLKVGNGAAMITDARNGQILAMVGSRDYFDPAGGNFNVSLSLRPPGSSIKIVTYAQGFKQGYSPATILLDTPITFSDPWGNSYSPVNYDGKFHGAVTIRTALGSSYNIPAVKMLSLVGLNNMMQTAKDMGITTFTRTADYGLSLTLGGEGVRMIDMMSVYGTLASGGVRYRPQAILKVTDPNNNVLEDNEKAEGIRVLTGEVAYLVSHILADNNARSPAFGPNSQLKIAGHTVAVKTGTSDNKKDNWAFGYTPEYIVGTWVGNNDNSPMDPRLSSGITGATPIWHEVMTNLLFGKPDLAFARPSGIIETMVNGRKDLAISGQTAKTVVGYQKVRQKDETGQEKEVITYTDPFGIYSPLKTSPRPINQ